MGKARLQRILKSIQDVEQAQAENLAQDVKTSAQIFAVAQYATQRLAEVTAPAPDAAPDALPPQALPQAMEVSDAPAGGWSWETLKQHYGSFPAIRKALKRDRGISFAKSPRKEDLVAAWNGELPATAKRIPVSNTATVNTATVNTATVNTATVDSQPINSPPNSPSLEDRVAALEVEVRSLRSLLDILLAPHIPPH